MTLKQKCRDEIIDGLANQPRTFNRFDNEPLGFFARSKKKIDAYKRLKRMRKHQKR